MTTAVHKVVKIQERPGSLPGEVARAILAGFDKHYRVFREAAAEAQGLFERAAWPEMQALARERIQMYDRRVEEAVRALLDRYPEAEVDESLWPAIKLAYIGLLHDHRQPECAETFYNSVACEVLHRRHYHNEFIFWRPAVATEHLEGEAPTYRSYYPLKEGGRTCIATCSAWCARCASISRGRRGPARACRSRCTARSSSATRAPTLWAA